MPTFHILYLLVLDYKINKSQKIFIMLNIYSELRKEFQLPSPPKIGYLLPGGEEMCYFYMFSDGSNNGNYRFKTPKSVKSLFQFLYQIIFTDKLFISLSLFLKAKESYRKVNVLTSKLVSILPNLSDYLAEYGDITPISIGHPCKEIAKVCDFKTYKLARVRFELLRLRLIVEITYMIIKEFFNPKASNNSPN